MNNKIYPVTIIADRYGGTYSGAAFTAWNKEADKVPADSQGDDRTSSVFWANVNRNEIGFGSTPEEAYKDLYNKLREKICGRKMKYWICDIEVSVELSKSISQILKEYEITLDELFEVAIQNLINNPGSIKKFCEEANTCQEYIPEIKILRLFPVYIGETVAQARRRVFEDEQGFDLL